MAIGSLTRVALPILSLIDATMTPTDVLTRKLFLKLAGQLLNQTNKVPILLSSVSFSWDEIIRLLTLIVGRHDYNILL